MKRRQWCAMFWAMPLTFAATTGCGRGKARVRVPASTPRIAAGTVEEGLASWYGHPYHGRPTTSGEIYDMETMTAAHRTLPLGTRVRVENVGNGRSVEVRINDRGPFVGGRIVDLSRAAAREIQMIGPGTARVRVHVLSLPEDRGPGGFFAVQVGSFRNRQNAERLRDRLSREHGTAFLREYESPGGRFYRVLVGREQDLAQAGNLAAKVRAEGFSPLVIRVDQDRL